jgi:phytoene dehydrogenase-like protein
MSMNKLDVIVVGAGADALVAATVLAKAGRRVVHLVDEANRVGLTRLVGISSGFSAPICLDADWIPPAVAKAMNFDRGDFTDLDVASSVALLSGGFLSVPRRASDAATAIGAHSRRDGERWSAFTGTMRALAGFLEALYQVPPMDLDSTSIGDIASLFALGRSFRSLGRTNMSELLRVMPMPVQDLVDEWFTFDPLKAMIAAAAVRDIRQGPRSGGTSYVLLHYLTGVTSGAIRGRPWSRNGGAGHGMLISQAQERATRHGVTTRAVPDLGRILVRDDAAKGVVLNSGEEIGASMVLSTLDPARTLLHMIDSVWLDPEFLLAVRNIKFRGCTALVCYALDRLPNVPGLDQGALAGMVSLSATVNAIEKSYDGVKYGEVSQQPHIEITVPSLRWPSLAPEGKHVLVAKVEFVPRTLRDGAMWDATRTSALASTVTAAISGVVPSFSSFVSSQIVLTPRDIEDRFGVTEGAVTHGEITLDQILFMRPVAGWGQYATPVRGLYLGGPGTHPGPGVFGMSGLLAARRMLSDAKKGA